MVGVFVLSSTVFTDLFNVMFSRFDDANLSDFTTGRTEVWARYATAMFEDIRLLLFGQGCSDVIIGEKPTHNTLLESVFQLGVIGSVLMTLWMVHFVMTLLDGAKITWRQSVKLVVLLIGAFGPWMALDYLFFDEFFLLPIFVCAAVRFLHDQRETEYDRLY